MKLLTRFICCTALLLFVAGICQATQSGALLEISGHVGDQAVDLVVTDGVIHTGVFRNPFGQGFCTAPADNVLTDAFVLQGGSATGCDPNDVFETHQGTGTYTFRQAATETQPGYQFDITTQYLCGDGNPTGEGGICTPTGEPICNWSNTICAEPDTGFLTVTNNGPSSFTGTITLSGKSTLCRTVSDSFPGTLFNVTSETSPSSVTLMLPTGSSDGFTPSDSSNCGGFTSDTIASDFQSVHQSTSPQTVSFLQGQEVDLTATFPANTIFGDVTRMREVLELVDPSVLNPALSAGTGGNTPDFSHGSSVPKGTTCTVMRDGKCANVKDECWNGDIKLSSCLAITPPPGKLINLLSQFFPMTSPLNPVYLIAHDDQFDWANITKSFDPGDVCPPSGCRSGGGGGGLNGQKTLAELNLGPTPPNPDLNPTNRNPQVLSFAAPADAFRNHLIILKITLRPQLPTLGAFGALTTQTVMFRLKGNLQPTCSQKIVTFPPFPLFLPAAPKTFTIPLTIPNILCPGTSAEISATTISGDIVYVAFADVNIH